MNWRGMTRFNMDEEIDEGHFDKQGNYIWDEDSKKVQEEAWLDNFSEQQMGAAKSAKSRREFRDEQTEETMTEKEAIKALATLLKSRETVLQALKRLGSKKSAWIRPGDKRKRVQKSEPKSALTVEKRQQFEQVTEAADFLIRLGDVDVYSKIKEEFISKEDFTVQRRRVQFAEQREGKSDKGLPKHEVMWEYKATDGQIHGPFPTSNFVTWQQQGYFKGKSAVDMRIWQSGDDVPTRMNQELNRKRKQEVKKVSVEQDLLNDFEDSANEADSLTVEDEEKRDKNLWKRSDTIDFCSY